MGNHHWMLICLECFCRLQVKSSNSHHFCNGPRNKYKITVAKTCGWDKTKEVDRDQTKTVNQNDFAQLVNWTYLVKIASTWNSGFSHEGERDTSQTSRLKDTLLGNKVTKWLKSLIMKKGDVTTTHFLKKYAGFKVTI